MTDSTRVVTHQVIFTAYLDSKFWIGSVRRV